MKTKIASDFLLEIAQETKGYKIGLPWRFSEASLVATIPIIREKPVEDRPYRLLSEVKESVLIKDTGSIDKLELRNNSNFDVLAKAGEIVVGATQSRAITSSQIIFAGEKVVVPCACVYSTKGIRANQKVNVCDYAPSGVRAAVYKDYGVYDWAKQNSVWSSVKTYSKNASAGGTSTAAFMARACGANGTVNSIYGETANTYQTPLDDLAGRLQENEEKLKTVLAKVPKIENQVGIVLVGLDGVNSFDSYDYPESWDAFRRNVLKAEADKIANVAQTAELFEFKSEKAREIVKNLLSDNYAEKIVVERGKSKTISLEADKIAGELVILNDVAIACSFVQKAK